MGHCKCFKEEIEEIVRLKRQADGCILNPAFEKTHLQMEIEIARKQEDKQHLEKLEKRMEQLIKPGHEFQGIAHQKEPTAAGPKDDKGTHYRSNIPVYEALEMIQAFTDTINQSQTNAKKFEELMGEEEDEFAILAAKIS